MGPSGVSTVIVSACIVLLPGGDLTPPPRRAGAPTPAAQLSRRLSPRTGAILGPMSAALTTDLDRARSDLAEHGYCLLEGALEPERCEALRDRLDELAAQEI